MELLENAATKGAPAIIEDKLASKDQPMVTTYGSNKKVLNPYDNQDKEEKGLNTSTLDTNKSGRVSGGCANLEGSGDCGDIGRVDEELFASKEQSQQFARYLQKVNFTVWLYINHCSK